MARIERVTSPLPRECSTTEPHGLLVIADRTASALFSPSSYLCTVFGFASRIRGTAKRHGCCFRRVRYSSCLIGAGEGNRTLVVSLEGFCSTIELHPPDEYLPSASALVRSLWRLQWWRRLDSNQRRRKPTDLQSAPFNHSGTPSAANRKLWLRNKGLSKHRNRWWPTTETGVLRHPPLGLALFICARFFFGSWVRGPPCFACLPGAPSITLNCPPPPLKMVKQSNPPSNTIQPSLW